MKNIFLNLTVALALSLPAVAEQQSPVPVLLPPQSGQFGIPMRDTGKVESAIKKVLARKLPRGFQITEFSVDWAGIQCLDASLMDITTDEDSPNPASPIGVCVVKVSANQVTGVFSINRRDSGYSVDALVASVF